MFTVTFLNSQTNNEEVSRFFETLAAARKWAKWLEKQMWVSEARIFRGPAGGELLHGTPK